MQSRLILRPLPMILLAYLAAPVAATITLMLLMLATGWRSDLLPTASQTIPLIFICLLIGEIVVVTPLLLGFHFCRWPKLNGWIGVGLAVTLLGVWPALMALSGGPAAAGLMLLYGGSTGAAGAAVFRLLAARSAEPYTRYPWRLPYAIEAGVSRPAFGWTIAAMLALFALADGAVVAVLEPQARADCAREGNIWEDGGCRYDHSRLDG